MEDFVKRVRKAVNDHLREDLSKLCRRIVVDAVQRKWGWSNFTGNTITSYSCGLYEKGKLIDVYQASEDMNSPIRIKVTAEEKVFLNPDYDGNTRSFEGKVETDRGYGDALSLKILKDKEGFRKDGFYMVLTTGTEYSFLLEKGGNVLLDSYYNAPRFIETNLQKMR